MSQPNIVIVGAGIGGLSTLLALRHFGIDAVCFERAPELREVGAGIQVGPNGSRVLLQLGLRDALDATGVKPVATEVRRWRDGRILGKVEAHPRTEELFGAPYYTLHRADLHGALLNAVPPGTIQLGKDCVEVQENGQTIELGFADGSSFRADVVIGADGLRSALRRALEPAPPRFAGKIACRVLVPSDEVADLASPPTVRMWLGPRQHVVSYPVSGGRLLNLAAALPAGNEDPESWTRQGDVQEMLDALRGWDASIQRVLSAARSTLRLPLFDRPPLTYPGRGRLTLIGDAAHPMLPFFAQGASQAIEDAWVLACCLRGVTPSALPSALRRYEAGRRTRVADVQSRSARNGRLFTLPDGVGQWARDLVLRRMTLGSFSWLYGYDVLRSAPGF
jgi:salicylate hydroxylase